MDMDGPFGWNAIDAGQLRTVLEKLKGYEGMNLSDLRAAKCHPYPISETTKAARDRAVELRLNASHSELFSFRIQGAMRVICLNTWPRLELLWFDPNHGVYESNRTDN